MAGSWRDTPDAQASIQAIGEAVAEVFGEVTKENQTGQLAQGYIGTTLDKRRGPWSWSSTPQSLTYRG